MSKIKYHKCAHIHPGVRKVKRMLNAVEKRFGGYGKHQFYEHITLIGIEKNDLEKINCSIVKHLKLLNEDANSQIRNNEIFVDGKLNDNYEPGIWLKSLKEQFAILEELENISKVISNEYPEIEIKRAMELQLKGQTPLEKFNESKKHFAVVPEGFNRQYFSVDSQGRVRELYPLTVSEHSFFDSVSVYMTFQ